MFCLGCLVEESQKQVIKIVFRKSGFKNGFETFLLTFSYLFWPFQVSDDPPHHPHKANSCMCCSSSDNYHHDEFKILQVSDDDFDGIFVYERTVHNIFFF